MVESKSSRSRSRRNRFDCSEGYWVNPANGRTPHSRNARHHFLRRNRRARTETDRGEYSIPTSSHRVELTGLGPVKVEARAEQGGLPGEYVVEGTAQFTADFLCSRCVEPYPFANDPSFT